MGASNKGTNTPLNKGNWNLLQLKTRLQELIGVVLIRYYYEEDLIWSIHNVSILAATKLEIMQCAVAKSPKVSNQCLWYTGYNLYWIQAVRWLLLRQSYFEQYLLPKIKIVNKQKGWHAHKLFNLTVTNDGQLLIRMYTKLDITF